MAEPLPEAGSLGGTGVMATGNTGKPGCLAALPATHSLDPLLIGVVAHIEAVAGGTDIRANITVNASIGETVPVRFIERLTHFLGDTVTGDL